MRYQGAAAYSMGATERQERRQEQARPSFEVVTGGGLDARARAGVSPAFVARVRAVLLAAAVLVVIGMARVAISSATVSLLRTNATLSSQISEAETLGEELSISRSVLSSNSRISRIATQNYGMVLPAETITVDLGQQAEEEPVDAATPDGEAAQTDGEAGSATDLS